MALYLNRARPQDTMRARTVSHVLACLGPASGCTSAVTQHLVARLLWGWDCPCLPLFAPFRCSQEGCCLEQLQTRCMHGLGTCQAQQALADGNGQPPKMYSACRAAQWSCRCQELETPPSLPVLWQLG